MEIHLYRHYSVRIKCTQLKFSNYKYHFSQKLKRVDLDCLFYLFILKYGKNIMYPSFFTIATIIEYCLSLKHFLMESQNDCKRTWTETRTKISCFHIWRVPPTCYGRTLCTRCSWSNKTKFTVPLLSTESDANCLIITIDLPTQLKLLKYFLCRPCWIKKQ